MRRETTREQQRPRVRHVVVSRATEEEPVQADLDDASDASIDPRMVAADSGTPSLLEVFGIEDQERADQAVRELEQIEASAEAPEDDGVSDAIPTDPPPVCHLLRHRYVFKLRIDLTGMYTMLLSYAVQPRGLPHFYLVKSLR